MADYDPASIQWDAAPGTAPVTTPVAPTTAPVTGQPDKDGVVWDTHPADAAAQASPNYGMSEGSKYLNNFLTGVQNSGPALLSMPNSLGKLGDWAIKKTGLDGILPTGVVAKHTYSFDDINNALYGLNNATVNRPLGLPDAKPYVAETFGGRVGQDILAGAPFAGIGGGGIPGLLARELSNAGGAVAGETAKTRYPDSPGVQLGASLLGALAAGQVPSLVSGATSGAANVGAKLVGTDNAVRNTAAANILKAAEVPKDDLVSAIDTNLPKWEFPGNSVQPQPSTATVTQNPGLLGMTYADQTAASKAGNPIYRTNDQTTNAAQREAVANLNPDIAAPLAQAQSDVTAATNALPSSMTAQDAGNTFRTGLQTVYDQRLAAQRAAGNEFDLLSTSPRVIQLTPIMDKATELATSNAGEVGSAYKAAASQFRSGMGAAPLDTSLYAQSVLAGLGDLAKSYPSGSAANRAVNDILDQTKASVYQQAPEIFAARSNYHAVSRPLDIFDPTNTPGPIANAVQTTRFGGYTVPNDSVVSQFLRSSGSADAIDRLSTVFGDVKSAVEPLGNYIAGQVKERALNPDGSVNLKSLGNVMSDYGDVLNKLPFASLKQKFSTLQGAQEAVNDYIGRQTMHDTFANGLGTLERDAMGSPVYAASAFDKFVKKNQGDLPRVYGQDGADTINQINQQLIDAAQVAQTKIKGTSGTAQLVGAGSSQPRNVMASVVNGLLGGEGAGVITGAVLEHGLTGLEHAGFGLTGVAASLLVRQRLAAFNTAVEKMTRNALTDPNFARELLTKYNPKMPTPAGNRAMNYVRNSLSGVLAPALATPQ